MPAASKPPRRRARVLLPLADALVLLHLLGAVGALMAPRGGVLLAGGWLAFTITMMLTGPLTFWYAFTRNTLEFWRGLFPACVALALLGQALWHTPQPLAWWCYPAGALMAAAFLRACDGKKFNPFSSRVVLLCAGGLAYVAVRFALQSGGGGWPAQMFAVILLVLNGAAIIRARESSKNDNAAARALRA